MEEINKLWSKFNITTKEISALLNRTNNIVGEYAEYIVKNLYNGEYLPISEERADIVADNKYYEVKSRKIKKLQSTQLNVIRSWNFDFLIVILFDLDGKVLKALEVPMLIAKEYSRENKHQNGYVITTNQLFLNDSRSKDLTAQLNKLMKKK